MGIDMDTDLTLDQIPGVVDDSPPEFGRLAEPEMIPSSQFSEVNFVEDDFPDDVISATDQMNSSAQDHNKILAASEFAGITGQVKSLDELSALIHTVTSDFRKSTGLSTSKLTELVMDDLDDDPATSRYRSLTNWNAYQSIFRPKKLNELMNASLPHDHKSVTRALSKEYRLKCSVAFESGSLKALTREWRIAAMTLKGGAKDGTERKLSSFRRTLHNNFNRSLQDLQVLGEKNLHSSLLISYGTFPGSERQDIFIGGTSEHINDFFRLFSRANASALGSSLQSFHRSKLDSQHATETGKKWQMIESLFHDPRVIDFSGCINTGRRLQMFRPGEEPQDIPIRNRVLSEETLEKSSSGKRKQREEESTGDSPKTSSKTKRREQSAAEVSDADDVPKKKVRINVPGDDDGVRAGSHDSLSDDIKLTNTKTKLKRIIKKASSTPELPFVIPPGSKDTFNYTYPPKQGLLMDPAPPCLLAYSRTAQKELESKLTKAAPISGDDLAARTVSRLKVFSSAQNHDIILQMSRDPRSRKLQQYLTHYSGLRPFTPDVLPRVTEAVPLGASDPPNLQYGRDGTSHFVDWHDAESSSSPWVLVKKEFGSGDERKKYQKGIIEAAALGCFATNWNAIPSSMIERGQIMYNAPTGCRTHKIWYPVHKQDESAKRLAMSHILAADPAERWVLMCANHLEELEIPRPGFANYFSGNSTIKNYIGWIHSANGANLILGGKTCLPGCGITSEKFIPALRELLFTYGEDVVVAPEVVLDALRDPSFLNVEGITTKDIATEPYVEYVVRTDKRLQERGYNKETHPFYFTAWEKQFGEEPLPDVAPVKDIPEFASIPLLKEVERVENPLPEPGPAPVFKIASNSATEDAPMDDATQAELLPETQIDNQTQLPPISMEDIQSIPDGDPNTIVQDSAKTGPDQELIPEPDLAPVPGQEPVRLPAPASALEPGQTPGQEPGKSLEPAAPESGQERGQAPEDQAQAQELDPTFNIMLAAARQASEDSNLNATPKKPATEQLGPTINVLQATPVPNQPATSHWPRPRTASGGSDQSTTSCFSGLVDRGETLRSASPSLELTEEVAWLRPLRPAIIAMRTKLRSTARLGADSDQCRTTTGHQFLVNKILLEPSWKADTSPRPRTNILERIRSALGPQSKSTVSLAIPAFQRAALIKFQSIEGNSLDPQSRYMDALCALAYFAGPGWECFAQLAAADPGFSVISSVVAAIENYVCSSSTPDCLAAWRKAINDLNPTEETIATEKMIFHRIAMVLRDLQGLAMPIQSLIIFRTFVAVFRVPSDANRLFPFANISLFEEAISGGFSDNEDMGDLSTVSQLVCVGFMLDPTIFQDWNVVDSCTLFGGEITNGSLPNNTTACLLMAYVIRSISRQVYASQNNTSCDPSNVVLGIERVLLYCIAEPIRSDPLPPYGGVADDQADMTQWRLQRTLLETIFSVLVGLQNEYLSSQPVRRSNALSLDELEEEKGLLGRLYSGLAHWPTGEPLHIPQDHEYKWKDLGLIDLD